MAVLIDTSFIVKAHCSTEKRHEEAKNWFKKLIIEKDKTNGTIYISDFVCDEIATRLFYDKKACILPEEISKLLKKIFDACSVFWIDKQIFDEAQNLFAQSKMSFTDCTTLVLYKKLQTPDKCLAHFDNRDFNRSDIIPLC